MRVLLDECVPRRLRLELPEHDVQTVPDMGWASIENGDLLRPAADHFEVLVTTDQKLSYQQNIADVGIAVVVLMARRNKLEFLRPLMPELRETLTQIRPGEVRRIGPLSQA